MGIFRNGDGHWHDIVRGTPFLYVAGKRQNLFEIILRRKIRRETAGVYTPESAGAILFAKLGIATSRQGAPGEGSETLNQSDRTDPLASLGRGGKEDSDGGNGTKWRGDS